MPILSHLDSREFILGWIAIFTDGEVHRSAKISVIANLLRVICYRSENELDEWHRIVTELSEKNQDEFSLRNLWLTTSNGELLEAGLMKISGIKI